MDEVLVALHQSALNYPGGITAVAKRMGMSPQILTNKLNPHNDINVLSIGQALAIMHITNDSTPLEYACADMGGQFFTRTHAIRSSLLDAVVHATKEHGDIARAVENALADGRITDRERTDIRKEISEARTALAELENTLISSKVSHI